MRFESVADELYAAARDEFTALRNERAAQAKAAGEHNLATRIRGLHKPTSAAWLANQLARKHAEQIGKLEQLGESMRRAHTELDGDELRALSRRRHDLVQALTDQARSLGKDRGVPVSDSVSAEVADTLDAALGDPDAARELAEGRLATALHAGESSSERWLSAAAVAPGKPNRSDTKAPARQTAGQASPGKASAGRAAKDSAKDKAKDRAKDKEGRQRAREAERAEAARLRVERANARKAVRDARTARDQTAKRLRDAERAEEQARTATAAARADADQAEHALAEAEQSLAEFG